MQYCKQEALKTVNKLNILDEEKLDNIDSKNIVYYQSAALTILLFGGCTK